MEEIIQFNGENPPQSLSVDAAALVLKVTSEAWLGASKESSGRRIKPLAPPRQARIPIKRDYLRLLMLEI